MSAFGIGDSDADISVLSAFLRTYSIDISHNKTGDMKSKIEAVFHLLNEGILREICNAALAYRDSHPTGNPVLRIFIAHNAVVLNLDGKDALGSWGRIIDVVRNVVSERRYAQIYIVYIYDSILGDASHN